MNLTFRHLPVSFFDLSFFGKKSIQFFCLSISVVRVVLLTLFVSVMIILYLSPLMSTFPCICTESQLPPKPNLVGHRGAAAVRIQVSQFIFYKMSLYIRGSETFFGRLTPSSPTHASSNSHLYMMRYLH